MLLLKPKGNKMKTYICNKKVQAERMTRVSAEKLGLTRDIKPEGTEDEEGYRVIYEDGYESWSPYVVFVNGYTLEETYKSNQEG